MFLNILKLENKFKKMRLILLALVACLATTVFSEKIVGGRPTTHLDHNHQISMRSGTSHICGGSLICVPGETTKTKWVITAAHCSTGSATSYSICHSTTYRNATSSDPRVHPVAAKFCHESYNANNFRNDICLLKLRDYVYLDGVNNDCIDLNDEYLENDLIGMTATTSGWGTLSPGGSLPMQLYEVDLPVVGLQNSNYTTSTYDPVSMMLAGDAKSPGKDTCQGDSGGPLFVRHRITHRKTLCGLTSWGYSCGWSGVYTRVSTYVQWIRNKMAASPN